MDKQYYLLRLRVNGIKSIAREIELNFYNKVITTFNPELYRVKAIYGENGSGKTAIVTALNVVKKIVLSPNYLLQTETQSLLKEIVNKKTKQLSLELEFADYGEDLLDVYRYSLLLGIRKDDFEIIHECLDAKFEYTRNKKYKNIFEIVDGKLISADMTDQIFELVEKKTLNLLSKKSFAAECVGIDEIDDDMAISVFKLLFFFLSINVYLDEEDMHEMYLVNKLYRNESAEKKDFAKYLSRQIVYIDSKGRDIVDKKSFNEYKTKVNRLEKFIKKFKPELNSISIEKKDDGDRYKCELILNYKGYSVNREFESTGIKKLIKMFDSLSNADAGGISFIDEMDSNINDIYLCKIIEYFMYYGKGQLCFTTHNLDPMTVLKNNKNAIDFLSSDNTLVSWKVTGNSAPERYYKNGMIENSPFNIDAIDFIGTFGD